MAMPTKQLKFATLFFSLFGLGVAVASYIHKNSLQSKHQKQLRTLASVQNSSTIKMEKHLMPIQVQIQPPVELPEGPGEIVTLKGIMRTNFENFGPIYYEWILPSDVTLVKGLISSSIASPVPGQDYEVEITLQDFDRQYRKELTLKAQTDDPNGNTLHNASVITSRPEDSMEHIAPAMMLQAQEFAEKNRQPASTQD